MGFFYVILLKIVQSPCFPSLIGKKHFLCGAQPTVPFLPLSKVVPNKGKNNNLTTFYPSSIFPTTFTQNKQAHNDNSITWPIKYPNNSEGCKSSSKGCQSGLPSTLRMVRLIEGVLFNPYLCVEKTK